MAKGGRGRGGSRRGKNRGTCSTGASPTTNASNDRRRRRGPPAIFITCEVGREGKCQREAIELIHHYYYNNAIVTTTPSYASSHINDASLTTTANDDTMLPKNDSSTQQLQEEEEEEPTSLSLEDELAMLRKGAAPEEVLSYFNNSNKKHNDRPNSKQPRHTSATADVTFTQQEKRQKMSNSSNSSMKSPFIVYDTGMRGTVCIVCTIPQCELIPYDKILSTIRLLNSDNNNNCNNNEKNNGSIIGSGGGSDDVDNETATARENTYVNKQRESTNEPTTGVVVNGNGKLQDEGNKDYTTHPSSSSSSIPPPLLWDPVETVRCIFRDTKKNAATSTDDDSNNDTDARTRIGMNNIPPPGSRYITRMIPIQATVSKGCRDNTPFLLLLIHYHRFFSLQTFKFKVNYILCFSIIF
jgi:hypothetical protein